MARFTLLFSYLVTLSLTRHWFTVSGMASTPPSHVRRCRRCTNSQLCLRSSPCICHEVNNYLLSYSLSVGQSVSLCSFFIAMRSREIISKFKGVEKLDLNLK
jgi:hypothetical protein